MTAEIIPFPGACRLRVVRPLTKPRTPIMPSKCRTSHNPEPPEAA